MSIADSYVPTRVTGDGSTVVFTGSWPIFNASYLKLYSENKSTGALTLQVKDTDYTLTFTDSGWSADFTISGAPASTVYIVGERVITQEQTTPYKTSSGFDGSREETSFDVLTGMVQELQDQLDRSLTFQVAQGYVGSLPAPVDGYGVVWNGATGAMRNTTSSLADLEGDAETVADNIASVNTVAGSISNVNTVAGSISNVNTVASNIANVNTVAGISSNVTTVAGISANVTTVAGIETEILAVYAALSDITDAANNIPKANRAATTAPTKDEDSADGYSAGSLWVDVTNNKAYTCLDATAGAAIWSISSFPFVSVRDYGAQGDGTTDDSAAIQAAVDAITSGGICFFPAGNYLIDTKITMDSNVKFMGEGYSSRLNKYGSSSDHFVLASSGSGTLSNVEISGLRFTTDKVSASGTQSIINFDGPDVDNVKIDSCFFENTTAFCDSVFFKAASGKTITNVVISNNEFRSSDRMAIELINHDNTSNYNISNIRIVNNKINNCASMGVSLSGPVEQFVIANNNIEDCATYGLEFAGGPRGGTVLGNVFSGTFTYLISNSNGGSYAVGNDIAITGNSCNGQVTGDIRLENYGTGVISGNKWNLSGRFIFVNTNTFDCLFVGNSLISNSAIALICDDSPDNMIIGNYIDNSSQGSNQSTVRAFDTSGTGIILMGNTIYKGTGGNHYDGTSGGTFATARNNILSGVPEDEVIKDYRIYKDRGLVTTAGTTSTCTITFASSASWRPQTVKAAVTNCETGSANGGHAETHWGVRTNNSASTVQIVQTDISTSANCVLSDSYGNQTMTITATVPGAGAQVLWDLEIIGWGLVQSVVFA